MTFSIVTVTYNAADCLERTLASVRRQTHPDIEHLIVDGASSDNTLAIAQSYADEERARRTRHTVSITSEPDNGIYYAMNKALGLITGDYVIFLNAGDALPEADTLARLAEVAESGGDGQRPAVLYGHTAITDSTGRPVGMRRLEPPERLSWRDFQHGMLVCHQAFYARADIARRTPYDTRYRLSADVDWCIRVMREAERLNAPIANARQILALYTAEGQTTRNHRRSLIERFRIMARHYGLPTTLYRHITFLFR